MARTTFYVSIYTVMEIKIIKKVPPRQILKSNYVEQTHIISFHHKDALGREKQKNEMVL